MRIRLPLIASFVLIALMLAVSAWGWAVVPEGARITTHWDANGRPNGFMPKEVGLLLLPAIGVALTALLAMVPVIEPRRQNLIASRKLYFSAWIGGLGVLAVSHIMTVASAAGTRINVPAVVLIAVAALMIVLGNFLGKSRSTFLVGMRLPWTLTSEYAWHKSNRLMGLFMVATGILTLPALYFLGTKAGFAVLGTGIVSGTIVGSVASYVYWRSDPNRQTGDMAQE
jgi:uncharacterized membrane protein